MSDYDGPKDTSQGDPELQEFLMIEKQKAQVNAQVNIKISNPKWRKIVKLYFLNENGDVHKLCAFKKKISRFRPLYLGFFKLSQPSNFVLNNL